MRFVTVSIMKELKFCMYRDINIRPDILIFYGVYHIVRTEKKQKSLNILSTYLPIDYFGCLDEFVAFKNYCNSLVSKITVTPR